MATRTEHAGPSPELVRVELQHLLATPDFASSKRMSDFLRYVVEESLQGRADRIKERTVAVNALGRDESYDPRIDPVVRVVAGRLRRSLEKHYATEGAAQTVRIEIPKGQYEPVFVTDAAVDELPVPAPQIASVPGEQAGGDFRSNNENNRRSGYVRYGIASLCVVGMLFVLPLFRPKAEDNPLPAEGVTDEPAASVVEQTGALPYRHIGDTLEILLVRTLRDSHWTIPKATQYQDASPAETAGYEAFKEVGVRGTAASPAVGEYHYDRKGRSYRVTVYPILVEEELAEWPEQTRRRQWCSVRVASKLVASHQLGELIARFEP